jgi:hypothetical protein
MGRKIKLLMVFPAQMGAVPLPISVRIFSQINGYIIDLAQDGPHQLSLRFLPLKVESA